VNTQPSPPRKLRKADVRENFRSGAEELDDWLKRFAWQNQQANNATTYVSIYEQRVIGYYAITVASVARELAQAAVAKHAPRQVPCLLMARLAVDYTAQGSGIGRALLADALHRAARLAETVGIRALLLHARDDEARRFYLSQAEFLQSPTDPLHLLLPIKDITRQFGSP